MDIVERLWIDRDAKDPLLYGERKEAAKEIERLRKIATSAPLLSQQQGCVCPVGSEATCQGFCPRKPIIQTR